MDWNSLANRTLVGHEVSADEALSVLRSSDDELLPLNPSRDIRVAGGREVNLRQLQALYPANSPFCNGYLTTSGQGYEADLRMIADAGFQVAELVEA